MTMPYDWFGFRLGAVTRMRLYGISSNYASGLVAGDVDFY